MLATETRPAWLEGDRLLGCLRPFAADRLGFLARAGRAGDVVGFRLASRTFFLVVHPDGVKRVLVDNAANYGKETRGQELLKTVLGDGLVTSEGEAWRRQRRLAQPAFHKERIASFVPLAAAATRDLLASWDGKATVEVSEAMMRVALTIVGRALMGRDLADSASEVGAALTVVLEEVMRRTTSLVDYFLGTCLPTPRNIRFKRAIAELDRVVNAVVAERRRNPHDGRDDLLARLVHARDEDGSVMSERLLRDQVMTMILAGHETTANALAWTFVLLSRNPAVERRARAEVEAVLGGREPTAEDLPRLRYVLAVVEEAMRLYPPVWTLARSVAADDVLCGVRIPRGSYLFLSPWVTHRHPAFFENPEGFDPERFLGPEQPSRWAYFPFGGGGRQCIGSSFALMEAQVVLAMTLQRYRLDLEPAQKIEPEPGVTLRPRGGVRMRVVRV